MNAWYSQNTRSIYIVALFSILYMQPLGCADSAQSHDLEYSERTLENDQATSDEEYAAGEEDLTDLGMEQPETGYLPTDEGLIPPDADCQLLATSQNEEEPVLCLDSLHREDSTQYCDPQRLSDLFKEELDLEVECVDFDLDCYFVCEGWTLPPELQDLDDQRDFIRGDHLDQALAEPPSTSCSLPAPGTATCCVVEPETRGDSEHLTTFGVSPLMCQIALTEDPRQVTTLIRPCQGGGLLWVTSNEEELTLHALSISELELRSEQTASRNVRISEVFKQSLSHLDVTQIRELQCMRNREDQSLSGMLIDQTGQLLYFAPLPSGSYEVSPLYPHDASLTLTDPDEPLLEYPLHDLEWSARNLRINAHKFFHWELQVSFNPLDTSEINEQPAELRTFRYEDHAYLSFRSRQIQRIPESVQERVIIRGMNGELRAAQLDNNGQFSLQTEDRVVLERSNRELNGLVSTSQVLALTSPQAPRTAEFYFWGSERLWSQEDSDLRVPLVFDASQHGFRGVEVRSLSGDRALLKLTPSEANRNDESDLSVEWALYDLLGDRLQRINIEALTQGRISGYDFKTPLQSDEYLIWSNRELRAGVEGEERDSEAVSVVTFNFRE